MRLFYPATAVLLAAALYTPLIGQATTPAPQQDHPGEVAFVDEGAKGFVYRRFPTGERLYTYDRDPPGQSTCNYGCMSAWPPVLAKPDAASMGDWTIVTRFDGKRQWALKGKPVYTRFHDSPDVSTGDGIDGVWHLVDYVKAPSPAH